MQRAVRFFGISAACAAANTCETTLRRYERLGVISPQRDSTGRRLYTVRDITIARQFRARSRRGRPKG